MKRHFSFSISRVTGAKSKLISAKGVCIFIIILSFFSCLPAFSQQNPITVENAKTGNPPSEWDIIGAGDLSIQGFSTELSINTGETVHFKIDIDPVSNFTIRIYRLGYYGGSGARLVANLGPFTGVAQPAPEYDPATGKTDCVNWSESASWVAMEAGNNVVSGIYVAKLTRTDNGGSSHIVFIVRDDTGNSDLLFKTSDATWQAYNSYGGNSFYYDRNDIPNFTHAVKASYNRPFYTRSGDGGGGDSGNWLFNAEYPMLRWLERNGYSVSYTTDIDMGRSLQSITPTMHKILMSVGHDEYWSGTARANFETARNNGVSLAFFSGNEVYWKTRWEDNGRTLVCYKEGTMGENNCGGGCDPTDIWTGLWRDGDPRVYPGSDGFRPENSLTGQISWYLATRALEVPSEYKDFRFWRNTSVASLPNGQTLTLPFGTLGYEMDWEQYFDYYPARRITLSSTIVDGRTHKLSIYRHSSGALVFGAGTVQWAWGLDQNHEGGDGRGGPALPPSVDMQQATLNLLTDMGVLPLTRQSDMVMGPATDITNPATVITFPTEGSTIPNSPVTITGTASDIGGTIAGVELSVDGGITWEPATGTTSWSFTWIPSTQRTLTIKSRAYDDSWNVEETETPYNVVSVSIALPECPCSIWSAATLPSNISVDDANPVELGVRFRSNSDGFISGIRFYKSAENTGTHIGNLWSSTGTNLARATFFNESASGWQEVLFSSPVAISSGMTYVASYHTSSGHYSGDHNYFANSGYSSFYLEALQTGIDGPNGVYHYGTSAFPTDTYMAANYYVDVVFVHATGPDTNPPQIVSVFPSPNSSGVGTTIHPSAVFNEALDPLTVTTNSVKLSSQGNVVVDCTVNYTGNAIVVTPLSILENNTLYTLILEGASSQYSITDVSGNKLTESYIWSFTTTEPPPTPPTEGPGGPILVISGASNPFSRYMVEILKAEGLNEFFAMDISEVTPAVLNEYDVVILGEFPITDQFVADLTSWVTAGGTLIAMKPDTKLSNLLGINPAGGTLSDQYLLVNTSSGPGVGIVGETIQFHSAADLYTLNGAVSLATLYSSSTTATSNPAVTMNIVGTNGGKAFAFTYDLTRSVVYTRQGNPAWAGQKRDGTSGPIRSDDLFFPDWIDLNKVAIPQADEQQRLLANIIILGASHRKPLPRFWFLPKGLKAAIVMTGDGHGDYYVQQRFEQIRLMSPPGCNIDDWECIRATGYIYPGSTFTNTQAVYYNNIGFETALHVNSNCDNYTIDQFRSLVTNQIGTFTSIFPGIPRPSSNRNHCIAWPDWSSTAEVEAENGIRLDANYYYWPNNWTQNRPGMFTGSGYPMRFARLDGSIIDSYQLTTQMQDEYQPEPVTPYPDFTDALLDKAIGPEGFFGVFCANMHLDSETHAGTDAIIASATERGIPVVSAKQILDWLDGRNSSSFGNISWNQNVMSFSVAVGTGANNLRGMLPYYSGSMILLSLTFNESPVDFTRETIKGINYAFFPALQGDYIANYGVDNTAPLITNVIATPHGNGTATITWTTNEPADSRVDFGSTSGLLTSNVSEAALVTSHSIIISDLLPYKTYYYRVTSTDYAGNEASSPVAPVEYSFTTSGICAQDIILADFNQGTFDINTMAALDGDGAVILKPALAEEFSGTDTPINWFAESWSGGVMPLFDGLQAVVDGSHVVSDFTFSPGAVIEFVATFTAASYQNVGFSRDAGFNDPWIAIGKGGEGDNNLYARRYTGSAVSLGSNLLNSMHNYKIKWNADNFEFYIDGASTPSATLPITINSNMVIQISDFNPGGGTLSVDWIRVTPYSPSGSFTSRIIDAGSQRIWNEAVWNADIQNGTSLSIFARTGDTPDPVDGSWTEFTQLPGSGSTIGRISRFIQYRADLSAQNTLFTPVLRDISFLCSDLSGYSQIWTGDVSSEWADGDNWSSGEVPSIGANILIPSTNVQSEPLITSVVDISSMDIQPGRTLTIGLNGFFTASTVNNNGILTINPPGRSDLGTLINNGTLNLQSDEDGIASLILNSYSDNGIENIELYLTGGGDETNYPWHYISSPAEGLSTASFISSGADPAASDLAAYREDLVLSTASQHLAWWGYDGWDYQYDNGNGRATTDSTFSILQVGRGYNYYSYSNAKRIFGGNLNTTNITKKLLYSGTGDDLEAFGWNLLGNPFTSGLDWEAMADAGRIPPKVDKAIYFTSNNGYACYVPGNETDPGIGIPAETTGNIPPMQGFFIKANTSGQFLTLPASARVHSSQNRYKGDAETIPLIRLKIEYNNVSDETVIRFSEKASDTFDSELDAYKFSKTGTKLSLWTTTGPASYSINSIPFPETGTEVPVGINIIDSDTYKLTTSQLHGIDNYNVYLIDKTTAITTDLRTNPSINFSATEGMFSDRFVIRIIKISTEVENVVVSGSLFNIYSSKEFINIQTLSDQWNGVIGAIDLIDMTGRTLSKIARVEFIKNDVVQIPEPVLKGLYFIKIQSEKMTYVGKLITR